jgi:hypothetical protein
MQPAFAQTPGAGMRCLVFPVKDLSPTDTTKDYESTIADAVRAGFSGQGYTVLSDAEWSSLADSRQIDLSRPLSSSDAMGIARAAGADLAVTGYFTLQDDQIHYSLQCWDVAAGTLTAGIEETSPFNLAFFSALSLAMNDRLIARVTITGKATPHITFTSPDEGMQVVIAGDLEVGRVSDGKLTFSVGSVAPGTKVLVHKQLAGYHTAEETVTLATDKNIPLAPLVKEHRAALELNMTSGQLLGMGATVRGYGIPDWLFVFIGMAAWVQPPATLTARVAFHQDTAVGIGGYLLLPPQAPVRLGLSSGVGMATTIMSEPGLPIYSDFYIDAANWWLEAGFPGTTFFMRQEYKYALGLGTNLLGQGWLFNGYPTTTLGVLFRW